MEVREVLTALIMLTIGVALSIAIQVNDFINYISGEIEDE